MHLDLEAKLSIVFYLELMEWQAAECKSQEFYESVLRFQKGPEVTHCGTEFEYLHSRTPKESYVWLQRWNLSWNVDPRVLEEQGVWNVFQKSLQPLRGSRSHKRPCVLIRRSWSVGVGLSSSMWSWEVWYLSYWVSVLLCSQLPFCPPSLPLWNQVPLSVGGTQLALWHLQRLTSASLPWVSEETL